MTFALPIALALAGLALPIIAFYILKIRLRRMPVSTNLFWKQIFDEKPPRSLWQNFRHLMSLLMQLALLALLVLAIADPYFPWQLLQARRIVMVIDASTSMQAKDVDPSRFGVAKKEAHEVINGLRFRDELAIVVAGKHPQVLVGMTNHSPTLRRAIDALSVTDSPTHLKPAIELGKLLLGNHPHGQVLVFTDGCVDSRVNVLEEAETAKGGRSNTLPSNLESKSNVSGLESESLENRVSYKLFATPASNVGITQFQVRRSLIDPIGYEVLVSVANASNATIRCRLELSLNDVPIDVLPIELKPEAIWSRSIEKTSLEGGQLFAELAQIRLADSEALGESTDERGAISTLKQKPQTDPSLNHLTKDDTAWAILPARLKQKVLIVSRGNLFLQKVFQANPLVEVTLIKDLPTEWPSDHILVLHGPVPTQLPSGSVLVIDPANDTDHWRVGDPIENPIVTNQDKNSPLMKHIRLDNVLMPQSRQLIFSTPPQILASTVTNDIVLAEIKRVEGKCLVLGVNLDQSDLAFRTAFPILATNALGWFAGQSGEIVQAYETGSSALVQLAPDQMRDTKPLELLSPSKRLIPFRVSNDVGTTEADRAQEKSRNTVGKSDIPEGRGRTAPWDEIGVWKLVRQKAKRTDETSDDDEPLMEFAVNLSNARESDLRPEKGLLELQQNQSAFSQWLSRPAWFYLVLVACVLTALEWFLYQRRLIT